MLETHFAGIITEKRHNFDPSTHPAGTENLHLNRETRGAPGPPVAHAQMAWEDADKVSFVVPRYSHRQAWSRAAEPLDRPIPSQGKKRN
jgi:hypothetical protein